MGWRHARHRGANVIPIRGELTFGPQVTDEYLARRHLYGITDDRMIALCILVGLWYMRESGLSKEHALGVLALGQQDVGAAFDGANGV